METYRRWAATAISCLEEFACPEEVDPTESERNMLGYTKILLDVVLNRSDPMGWHEGILLSSADRTMVFQFNAFET